MSRMSRVSRQTGPRDICESAGLRPGRGQPSSPEPGAGFGPIDLDEVFARGGVEVALGDLGVIEDLEGIEGVPGVALGDAALYLLL